MYKIFAAIIQRRLAEKLDRHLQRTQYGFRRNKNTAQAVHIIRRIIDLTEKSGAGASLVLLDWEKAFDEVSHETFFLSMTRLNVDAKYINLIRALYAAPYFKVEIEGHSSEWHKQHSGIRQGCPLSPYDDNFLGYQV